MVVICLAPEGPGFQSWKRRETCVKQELLHVEYPYVVKTSTSLYIDLQSIKLFIECNTYWRWSKRCATLVGPTFKNIYKKYHWTELKTANFYQLQSEDLWRAVAEQRQQIGASHFPHPDCRGYLLKLDGISRTWKRRFCVLADACLFIYNDAESPAAFGTCFSLSLFFSLTHTHTHTCIGIAWIHI